MSGIRNESHLACLRALWERWEGWVGAGLKLTPQLVKFPDVLVWASQYLRPWTGPWAVPTWDVTQIPEAWGLKSRFRGFLITDSAPSLGRQQSGDSKQY